MPTPPPTLSDRNRLVTPLDPEPEPAPPVGVPPRSGRPWTVAEPVWREDRADGTALVGVFTGNPAGAALFTVLTGGVGVVFLMAVALGLLGLVLGTASLTELLPQAGGTLVLGLVLAFLGRSTVMLSEGTATFEVTPDAIRVTRRGGRFQRQAVVPRAGVAAVEVFQRGRQGGVVLVGEETVRFGTGSRARAEQVVAHLRPLLGLPDPEDERIDGSAGAGPG